MFKKILNFIIKKKWLLLLSFLMIAGIFGWTKTTKAKKLKELKTAKAQIKNLTEKVSASGKVRADEEVTLKFQTSGRLAWVGVKKGDYVQKWQAIASLDKRELEKSLKKELLDYMNERWDFEQTTLDDYRDTALTETIRRAKEQAQFNLDRDVLDVEIADIALKYATLVTPIEGIVTEIEAPFAGVNITAATAEFFISNPKKLVFKAKVDEVDIGKVKIGQKAELLLDAYPEETVHTKVYKTDFTSTTTSGGGTAFEVWFELPIENEGQKFKIGMNGDVEIIISERKDVLVVPFETVREKDGQTYLWVLKDSKPEKTKVTTGFSTDVYTEIKSGIGSGEKVITSGFKDLEKNNKE